MRLIEKEMLNAIMYAKNWSKDNTQVLVFGLDRRAKVYLHGNFIGSWDYDNDSFIPDRDTLASWPTPTTKSRLRALGVDVTTKKGVTYLNGVAV